MTSHLRLTSSQCRPKAMVCRDHSRAINSTRPHISRYRGRYRPQCRPLLHPKGRRLNRTPSNGRPRIRRPNGRANSLTATAILRSPLPSLSILSSGQPRSLRTPSSRPLSRLILLSSSSTIHRIATLRRNRSRSPSASLRRPKAPCPHQAGLPLARRAKRSRRRDRNEGPCPCLARRAGSP